MDYKNSTDSVSSFIALVCLIIMIVFGICIVAIVVYSKKTYTKESLKTSKIKSLYSQMSNSNPYALYSHVVFIVMRVYMVFITLAFHHYGETQIDLFFPALVFVIIFKILIKPYDGQLRNLQDLLGHFLLLTMSVVYISFTKQEFELLSESAGFILGVL